MIKKDTLKKECTVIGEFSQPLTTEDVIPLKNFCQFSWDTGQTDVEQTNFYTLQKTSKTTKTQSEETTKPTVMMIKIEMSCFHSIGHTCSNSFSILLLTNLHLENYLEINKSYKISKTKLVITTLQDECIKLDPGEYQSVDEQIIPSKIPQCLWKNHSIKNKIFLYLPIYA